MECRLQPECLVTMGIQQEGIQARHDLSELCGLQVIPLGDRPDRDVAVRRQASEALAVAHGQRTDVGRLLQHDVVMNERHLRLLAMAIWLGLAWRST
jgi:hypothetical protein